MNLRMIIMAGVVVSAVVLPLVASAEPTESLDSVPGHAKSAHVKFYVDGLSDAPSEKGSEGVMGTAAKGSPDGSFGVGLLPDTDRSRGAVRPGWSPDSASPPAPALLVPLRGPLPAAAPS